MSNVIWTSENGWHDGPEVSNAELATRLTRTDADARGAFEDAAISMYAVPATHTLHTAEDVGCFFDGVHGQAENDARVIRLAQTYGFELDSDAAAVLAGLSDAFDVSELVSEAVDHLNQYATDGTAAFEWVDGDFVLTPNDDDDDAVSGVFALDIVLDSAAFQADPNAEVARILRRLADRIESPIALTGSESLRDINGNSVGGWSVR